MSDIALIVGDSISAEIRLGVSGWPTYLSFAPNYDNRAVSGNTLVSDIEPNYASYVAAADATVSRGVIQGGVNDIILGNTLGAMQTAVTSCINQSNAAGWITYVIGITPWEAFTSWTAGRQTQTDDYNAWLISQQATLDFTYIDAFSLLQFEATDFLASGTPDYNSGDGLHLNDLGQQTLGSLVSSTLRVSIIASAGTLLTNAGAVEASAVARGFSGAAGDVFLKGTRHTSDGRMYVTTDAVSGTNQLINGILHTDTGIRYVATSGGAVSGPEGFAVSSAGVQLVTTSPSSPSSLNGIARGSNGAMHYSP